MGKQTFRRVKKALIVLLLLSLVASLTAASVSAWASGGKTQGTQEKSTYAEKGNITTQEKGTGAEYLKEQTKGKVTANHKYVCDCCCVTHGDNSHWYCPGACFSGTCSQDCARD